MKLGVTYIVYSGMDLLKPSIINVRPFASHIVAVAATVSSDGRLPPPYFQPLLNSLLDEGLLDQVIYVDIPLATQSIQMQDSCRIKRETGRKACLQAGCTHHLIKDCDEFYEQSQFRKCLEDFPRYDCSIAPIYEYVNNPTYRVPGLSGLSVPVVQRIDLPLARNNPFGIKVDLGRTVASVSAWRVWKPEELVLHHMTFVRCSREELRRKYFGHGHLNRVGTVDEFLKRADSITNIEIVKDQFGVMDYWENEFLPKWVSCGK